MQNLLYRIFRETTVLASTKEALQTGMTKQSIAMQSDSHVLAWYTVRVQEIHQNRLFSTAND